MSKKPAILVFLLAAICSDWATADTTVTDHGKPPNILLAISDDQSYIHAGPYRHAPVRTPALDQLAEQGVLLLNATLTVRAHQAGSHQNKGWEEFTDAVIRLISDRKDHVVFLLWGSFAQSKAPMIDSGKHLILRAPHPSPLSAHRGFFGCRHFSSANEYLESVGLEPIEWAEKSLN